MAAKPKGRPKASGAKPDIKTAELSPVRLTIINLKGSREQAAWLDDVNRRTYIPKTTIVRLALAQWAEKNGHPPFPVLDDDE